MKILSCAFNMDTACVELRIADGTMISIDCTAVENEIADNMYQQSELDYLIYNDPVAYAELKLFRFFLILATIFNLETPLSAKLN